MDNKMTTDIYGWIDAQVDICKENVNVLEENRTNLDRLIIQLWALKKHVDVTLDFLERNKRFG